jgi:hypothetical protein
MDYQISFDAPAEKIYQDFISRQYWQTLMDAYRFLTPQSEITVFRSDDSGTDIEFVQNLPREYLPAVARTVMPADMIITRQQHFDPYDHENNRARGTFAASVPHAPGRFSGDYFLTDAAPAATSGARETSGSALRLASVCKVHLPLVGGILEDLILQNLKLLFKAEEAFTADWIAKHH